MNTYTQIRLSSPPRVIVALTIDNGRLVRTTKFSTPRYVGDPINAVKIFNQKGVDELVLLDISGKKFDINRQKIIQDVASEAFMPISYGGGIDNLEDIRTVIRSGFEKVTINSALHKFPHLAREASDEFGTQAIVGSMDVSRHWFKGARVYVECGKRITDWNPVDWAKNCEQMGCGELIVTSIDRDGSMQGYDTDLISDVADAVSIPVIALGGAGKPIHLQDALEAGASAVAAGSMFVFHGPRRAILINYPLTL
jgi:cyclase